jgi:hypothetical protein
MSGQRVTQIIGGPALITFRGATMRSKGDIVLSSLLSTFAINTSILGQVDERVNEHPIDIKFTPDGEWSNLGVLYPYVNMPFGTFITPQLTIGAIAGNQANIPNVNMVAANGDAVRVDAYGGTITTGLATDTLYYIHIVSSDAVTFHLTRADALTGANVIAISAGTGTTRAVVNNPLTIQTTSGQLLTFHNTAIVQMPGIVGSTIQTITEEVGFEAFLVNGKDWSDANSLYTIAANPWPGDSFTPANILTQPIAASWGNAAPWSAFNTKNGWKVGFALTLDPVEVDSVGILTRRLSNLVVTARAMPVGVTEADLFDALKIQGTNAGRGRSLGTYGANLDLSGTGFFVRLYNAALRGGPQMFSSKNDRTGELSWVATRTFSGGQPLPLFYVGSSALT